MFEQLFKFGFIGGIVFSIDYILLFIFTSQLGVNHLIANIISSVASMIVSYSLNMKYIFTNSNMKREKEFTVFTIMSVGGMALNEWLMYTGVDILQYDYRFVKILATFLVTIVNFTSRKVVFDRRGQEC